jgi:Domain of unknown function (DUF4145)
MQRYFDKTQLEALAGPFSEFPVLLCPVCRRISLELAYESFESPESRAGHDDENWDPTWDHGYFYGSLTCPRTPCSNKYAIAGRWRTDYAVISNGMSGSSDGADFVNYLSVTYILPAFPLMDYPDDVPDKVREAVAGAAQVVLSDASAAANRLRTAIEVLLDAKQVRQFKTGSRSERLNTHTRIELFGRTDASAAQHLMAMKVIGNVGSHEREILPLSEVLAGMEHFARALEIIYDRKEKDLERRAALISKKGSHYRVKRNP